MHIAVALITLGSGEQLWNTPFVQRRRILECGRSNQTTWRCRFNTRGDMFNFFQTTAASGPDVLTVEAAQREFGNLGLDLFTYRQPNESQERPLERVLVYRGDVHAVGLDLDFADSNDEPYAAQIIVTGMLQPIPNPYHQPAHPPICCSALLPVR